MVKRLTEYFENGAYTEKKNIIDVSDKVKFFDNGCVMGEAIDKLAQLEDVMEDYNIKTVEELGKRLEDVEQYNYETNRQFIDVMAKYGIESIEELDDFFANYKVSSFLTEDRIKEIAVNEQRKVFQSMIKEITEKECNQLYTELNTWKRACELACAFLAGITQDNVCDYEDYFYQQAKKEGG